MEFAVSTMETEAVAARNVANLVAATLSAHKRPLEVTIGNS
jgi:hypothetical protein